MRKCLLGFATVMLTFHLVGCDGGGGGSAAPAPDKQPTPEQQKEIDTMKENMLKGVKKVR